MEGLRRHGARQLRIMVAQYQEEDGVGAHCDGPGQVVLSGKTLWGCKLKNDREKFEQKIRCWVFKSNKRLVIVTFEMESLVYGGIAKAWCWAIEDHGGAISRRGWCWGSLWCDLTDVGWHRWLSNGWWHVKKLLERIVPSLAVAFVGCSV
nr:hypothetical protein CFP56_10774 [Quercus suber]